MEYDLTVAHLFRKTLYDEDLSAFTMKTVFPKHVRTSVDDIQITTKQDVDVSDAFNIKIDNNRLLLTIKPDHQSDKQLLNTVLTVQVLTNLDSRIKSDLKAGQSKHQIDPRRKSLVVEKGAQNG